MFNCIYGKSKNNISTRIFLFHTLVLQSLLYSLFDNQYRSIRMENHLTGNTWIKQTGKDIPFIIRDANRPLAFAAKSVDSLFFYIHIQIGQ